VDTIQAGTVAELEVDFFDFNGNAAVPILITYKIYCTTTGTLVRDTTSVSPLLSSIVIQLQESDTEIKGTGNLEVRKVCVTSTYGAGDSRLDNYRLKVLKAEPCGV